LGSEQFGRGGEVHSKARRALLALAIAPPLNMLEVSARVCDIERHGGRLAQTNRHL